MKSVPISCYQGSDSFALGFVGPVFLPGGDVLPLGSPTGVVVLTWWSGKSTGWGIRRADSHSDLVSALLYGLSG